MADDQTKPYEGMFLFPQSQAADLQTAVDHIQEILGRVEAQIISLRKWEERKLAYDIKGNKRGVYFLVYFNAKPAAIAEIERTSNLSEQLLRTMVTRADHLEIEEMQAADGRAELDDEIKLRSTEAAASSPERSGAAADAAEPTASTTATAVEEDPA